MPTPEFISMKEFRELKTLTLALLGIIAAMSCTFLVLYASSLKMQEARFNRLENNTKQILRTLNRGSAQQPPEPGTE